MPASWEIGPRSTRQPAIATTEASDVDSFLRSLEMVLEHGAFDGPNLPRITQLANKTNQWNLTTRRYTEAEIAERAADPGTITLWLRLTDRFGDNGLIGTVVARPLDEGDRAAGRFTIESWLMSCRVLGRQVEQGTLCPATMTQAAIPLLQKEDALWAELGDKLYSDAYDARDLPAAQKTSIWLGMGMTEKQGGSDVRANTTVATAMGAGGRGGEYLLRGHKWFFSAPQCDAHLVTARVGADGPFACFHVPRWRVSRPPSVSIAQAILPGCSLRRRRRN